MPAPRLWFFSGLAFLLGAALRAAPLGSVVDTFALAHCADCHDPDMKKGGFDLTTLARDLENPAAFGRWVQMFDRVTEGEMPPKSEPRPDAAAQRAFLRELETALHDTDAKRIARDGRVRARRLTRFEYERTLQDLLGIDVPLANLLPEDSRSDEFDTVSGTQQVSHFLLERYLAAIDTALDAAVVRAFEPPVAHRKVLDWEQLRQLRPGQREAGPRPAQRDVVAWSVRTAFHGRTPPTTAPESGWFRVTLRVAAVNPPASGEVWCSVRSGVCFATAATLHWVGSFAATPEVREHTFEAWIERGHMLEIRPHDSALKRGNFGTVVPTQKAEETGIPGVAIKEITVERIHRGPEQAVQRERLFAGVKLAAPPAGSNSAVAPTAAAHDDEPRKARKRNGGSTALVRMPVAIAADPRGEAARLVRTFAARAFRTPVSEGEAAAYVRLAHAELEEGATLLEAVRGAYRAILASPRFLYLEDAPGLLTPHALATRLSYFLWSSLPDDELRARADDGTLVQSTVLRAQVERMLAHPAATAFVQNFTDQWLNLAEIDATMPDSKLYPEFDEVLKYAMLDETRAFFGELLRSDLSATNVIDSSFTLINSRLARHYRIAWPGGHGMQRVALRPQDHRGGLITQASVLKVTANGTSTSPVLRGVWMLERILGVEVPPVPANVPAIEPDIRGARTIREQLDKHRNVAACAACHVKIDPPGFALETYDVTGAWRDRYRVANESGKGFAPGPAVDPSYVLPDGRTFADIAEFKRLALSDPNPIARNLAAKLVTYATGAGISFADRAVLEEIVASTRKSDHGVRSLVHAVVQSRLFRHK